jgi:peroxiredoxin
MTRDFDIVSLSETDHPEVGDIAPDFTRPLVNDEYWEDALLSEVASDGPVLLLFHPMNWSPTSINLSKELKDRAWEEKFDVTVIGINISTPYDHKRFIDENDIEYELFSDPTNEVAAEYGVVHDLDGMHAVTEPRPAVFLLDSNRIVQYVWVTTEWPAYPDYDAVEEAIAEL